MSKTLVAVCVVLGVLAGCASTREASCPEVKSGGASTAVVQRVWDAVGKNDLPGILNEFSDDLVFIFPGQDKPVKGKAEFEAALKALKLPAGFAPTGLRHIEMGDDVITLLDWKATKVPDGTQTAILFRMQNGKIVEERWYVDTVVWNNAL